uniref:Gustatory receptor n=1 Tax=Culicoides sonorensis TaxID=179676 RepID=A0A336KT66_CULSO
MSTEIPLFSSRHTFGFNYGISPPLFMAQLFGLMPVQNLLDKDVMLLEFKLYSWKSAYSLFCIIGVFMNAICALLMAYYDEFEFGKLSAVIFYGLNFYIFVQFFYLARVWPRLMRHWERVEYSIIKCRGKAFDKTLSYRLWYMTTFVMICCWVEHLGSILSSLIYMFDCEPNDSYFEDFFRGHLSHIFAIFNYNIPLVIIGKYFNIISTFAWSFMDLFVILNSIGMAHTFKAYADYICKEYTRVKCKSENFWSKQRRTYQKLVDLVAELDDETCSINLISFSNNVYFIIFQLLNSLNRLPLAHALYFWFSLIFLIMRTIIISICGAEIQDQAKRPLWALRKIDSDFWTEELRRFNEDIVNAKIGITGKKLFFINRGLLLSVAGTIITYELVLIQFRKEDQLAFAPCNE